MQTGILEEYLDRDIRVHYAPSMLASGYPDFEEGRLYDYSDEGILLELPDKALAYIPRTSIRMVMIKPKLGFWAALTRSS
ncbi:hypothetical protein NDK47_10730 [Brevibacillus ruminantium]|uniref:PilZ domain-containing protein n=1 Tax=Brevibacillus ruminantium TaxID=2950604 RepID=A0ABY4WKP1_9BACL|nr:hypothetical protein [Brevibacillus ruminantium]USG67716.1 hypothetical protein NDK47_10730 [Brevibacillus ruminantium]